MEIYRTEIASGVALNCLRSDKFKTACVSVNLLCQLQRETASINALVPYVLRRGTSRHGDMEALSRKLNELYGTAIEPVVRRIGEIQCIGFYGSFPESEFLPGNADLLTEVAALMGELLLSPNTRGGLLLPAYVDSEREKLLDMIRGRINEKRSYSISRLLELMCFGEDYAVSRLGCEDEAENIGYQKLTRHYRELLASAPVEIFYCGSAKPERVERALKDALLNLPRGEIDYEIGTDIRMNTLEDEPRYFTEELDVTQGKLAIGWRLGDCMDDPDPAAIRVFNAVYGGSVTSKLFENVREKLSLCYFASSMTDEHKGVMVVSSGIEFDKYDEAKDEIFRQLEAVKNGELTEEELVYAKRYTASSLRTVTDSVAALENFYLSQTLEGLDYGPEELAALCEDVTKEEVVAIARSLSCDAVYFLRGMGDGEEMTA